MKKFTKNDLQTGYIVVTKNEGNAILIGDIFKRSEYLTNTSIMTDLRNYNDDLTDIEDQEYDIEKVYKIICCERKSLSEIIDHLPEKYVELVWERPREIDWSKIEIDTPILVRDAGEEWVKGHFAGLTKDGQVKTWLGGKTSWTSGMYSWIPWEYAKI